jgi:hypothetical protein
MAEVDAGGLEPEGNDGASLTETGGKYSGNAALGPRSRKKTGRQASWKLVARDRPEECQGRLNPT